MLSGRNHGNWRQRKSGKVTPGISQARATFQNKQIVDGILLMQTFLAKVLFYSKSRGSLYEDRQIKVDNKYGLITMNNRNVHSIETRATSNNLYYQIQDDSNTLIALVEDMSSSDKIYQPTNY